MEQTKNDVTGFNQAKFRPVGNMLAVILTQEHIDGFNADTEKEAKDNLVIPGKKLFKGAKLEEEAKVKEATFIVGAISKALSNVEDCPEVGDRIGLLNGTPLNEFIVDGIKYGLIPLHKVACIIEHSAKVTAE